MNFQPTRLASVMAAALLLGIASAPVKAQTAASDDVTVELIQLLVEQGVLQQAQANALLQRAQAKAQAKAAEAQAAADPGAAIAQPGDVRVPYIPASVRKQIQQEVKEDMMAQAKSENWAQPNTFPDWVSRITVDGDVRVRNESRLFDDRNSNEIVDFNRFNENGPIATVVGNEQNPFDLPWMNTRQDRRNLWRFRARLGVKAEIADEWTAGIRLASGSDNNPVSTSDTLGGGMGKKDIWLDQVYMTYRPTPWAAITAGRASNPFQSTDMLYSDDLQFDGISAKLSHAFEDRPVTVFGNVGAFALEYANNPWRSDTNSEGRSENKWLLGGQIGAAWKPSQDDTLTGAVAYYRFENIAGRRSSGCTVFTSSDACDTDWSRPAFMQKGNTLFLLRDIRQWSADPADWNEWQYVGLASKFNLLDLNMSWETKIIDGMGFRLDGNYIRNLAYNKDEMIRRAGGTGNIVNSRDNLNDIESGPNAWSLQATVGRGLKLESKGDWRAFAGYKYIEPDAFPDGYNDSGFHLGGTNARGYFLGGAYAFDKNVWGQFSWSSSKEVYGAPLSVDLVRFDLNARF
ncbi:putative porin [Achromobacter pestifer]|uniref:Porin n=1 Tax=Achromobacter pestifer TaxID=1353889 RepID=A0A6S6ZZQ9_9BURK|nr:putative porin [Achromobacter pestifer]CAB3647244.1 hypothetical protein LMG3431_02552 [Achromobacter pestifer]